MVRLKRWIIWALCVVIMCCIPVATVDAGGNTKEEVTLASLLESLENLPPELQGKILEDLISPIKKKLLTSLPWILLKGQKYRKGTIVKVNDSWRGSVSSVAFSPNGRMLATGSEDRAVRLWNQFVELDQVAVPTRYPQTMYSFTFTGHQGTVCSLAFSPDSSMLASGSSTGEIKLWDVRKKRVIHTLFGHQGCVKALAFHPNGKILISVSGDSTVRLWDIQTGVSVGLLREHHGGVNALVLSPDGSIFATGSDDNTIKLWDIETRKVLRTLKGDMDGVVSISFHPSGRHLLSSSWDYTTRRWNLNQKNPQGKLLAEGHTTRGTFYSRNAFYSADGEKIVCLGGCGQIYLWDETTAKECPLFKGQGCLAHAIALRLDGKQLVVGYGNGVIELCDLFKTGCYVYDKEQDKIRQEIVRILDHSLRRLDPSQKFLLYLLDITPGEKNLATMERKLKQRFGDCLGLFYLSESYYSLSIDFRRVVKEHFNVTDPLIQPIKEPIDEKKPTGSICNVS